MSELKVIYLGPACQEQGDGREWCQDDVWQPCECGHTSVKFVASTELDRVTAERDGLQLSLNTADQTIDDLSAAVSRRTKRVRDLEAQLAYAVDALTEVVKVSAMYEKPFEIATLAIGELSASMESAQDDDWHMNPCKQGHRDVGAAGGVAACNQCEEKIEAATTQEAFERWNATHPASESAETR